MAKFLIASWNNGTAARALAEALDCKLMKKDSTSPIPRSVTHVINLGIGTESEGFHRLRTANNLVNSPLAVYHAQSKLRTFQRVRTAALPPHWTDARDANYACLVDGKTVVARTLDRGSSGAGIVVVTPEQARAGRGVPRAALYTQAIEKRREYRVHVGRIDGVWRVIDVTRKIRRPGVDDTNRPFIWNHDNDFIFVRNGICARTIPNELISRAQQAVDDLGLQFGAVDIVVEKGGPINRARCYVLEVNTSPGMEGTTLERYVEFFRFMAGETISWRPYSELEMEGTELETDEGGV
jgi:hypothetical protein